MRSRTWRSSIARLAIVGLSVVFPALGAAQTSSSRETPRPGALVGYIAGPDEVRLRGAVVTVTEVTSGSAVTVVTGAHGGYRATGLRPGGYELKAELVGFQPQIVSGLALATGQTREVDFTLTLSTYAEAVTVIGATARDSFQATEIRDSTARDIGEALSRVNGLSKVRKGGIGNDVVLHGYHGKDLAVLIDGQKVYGACPENMDPAVFHADFAEVDHVSVGKGPFDMFNQGSLGGVINVVTRKPAEGFHAEPNFSAGSFGYLNPSGTLSYGARPASLLGGYSSRSSNPYRDGSGARFTEYANYRSTSAASQAFGADTGWARLLLSPQAGQTIQVSYTRQRADHVLYPFLEMDALADNADRLRVGYERAAAGGLIKTLALDAYYTRVAHLMSDEFRTSSIGFIDPFSMTTQADSSIGGGKIQVGLGAVTAGVEVSRRTWNASTSMMADDGQSMMMDGPQSAIPDVATDSVGVYGSYRRSLGVATQVDVGGRLDWARTVADPATANTDLYFAYHDTRLTSSSDVMPSVNVRVSHRLSESVKIAGGIGHTERVPDGQERYYGLVQMDTDWVGNPTLPPTGNTGITADITYQRARVAASGSLYRDWLADYIAVGPQAQINSVSSLTNTSAQSYYATGARMTSGEAHVTYSFSSQLFTTAKTAYTRGTRDSRSALGLTGTNLAEIPPLNGSLSVRYDRVTMFADAEIMMAASQSHVDTDLQEKPTPGYRVLNLRVGRQIKALRVTFDVDNVLNAQYLDYTSYLRDPFRSTVRVREPGRNFYVNIAYRY